MSEKILKTLKGQNQHAMNKSEYTQYQWSNLTSSITNLTKVHGIKFVMCID